MAFVCIERPLFTVIDTGYTDCGVKKYFHISVCVHFSHLHVSDRRGNFNIREKKLD